MDTFRTKLKFAALSLIQSYLNLPYNGEKHPQKLWNGVEPPRPQNVHSFVTFLLWATSLIIITIISALLGGEQAWTSTFYFKSFGMDSVHFCIQYLSVNDSLTNVWLLEIYAQMSFEKAPSST